MFQELEAKIFYQFKDKNLLEKALSHKSQANEKQHQKSFTDQGIASNSLNNERLEFLGDAVLQLVISDLLCELFADSNEGELSKMRSALVNENSLAQIARSINLGEYIRLGKGEANTGGREKNSILACAYEAVLGAIYLEAGLTIVFETIKKHFKEQINQANSFSFQRDFKSLLQEWAQSKFRKTPTYKVTKEDGPDHNKVFAILVQLNRFSAEGMGRSKKEAEQAAAQAMLKVLDNINLEKESSAQ